MSILQFYSSVILSRWICCQKVIHVGNFTKENSCLELCNCFRTDDVLLRARGPKQAASGNLYRYICCQLEYSEFRVQKFGNRGNHNSYVQV
jgi:hypothetical protein